MGKKRKWWVGLNSTSIINTMKEIAEKSVQLARAEELEESERVYDKFIERFEEVIPAIVDMKSEYYMFRHYNNVFDTWDKCQRDLWAIRNGLESDLEKIYSLEVM